MGVVDACSSMKESLQSLRVWLSRPVDVASLALARICYGLIMLWEVIRYFRNGWIDRYWIDPDFHFTYFGFSWVSPWPGDGMHWHFFCLGILAIMITFGFLYRIAAVLFFLGFSYAFLLEQARYLNHFYLVSLVSFLMALVPANQIASIDARLGICRRKDSMPAWCLYLLRFQMGIVYFFGGIAKINSDWLAGEPLRTWLGYRAGFPIVGPLFEMEGVVMGMAYGGLLFDLLIVPLLLWRPTRVPAFFAVLFFNFSNAIIFTIGIFPFFAIAMSTLYFSPDWPRRYFVWPRIGEALQSNGADLLVSRLVVGFLALYVGWQSLLPLRHWLYPGNPAWTEEGHLYSWRMKLRSKSGRISFYATNLDTGEEFRIKPSKYMEDWQAKHLATKPDMMLQFVDYAGKQLKQEGITNLAIRAESYVSLNGRPRVQFVDPSVDLLRKSRSLFPKDWLLPLDESLPPREAE